jgi:hypothetical protein
MPITRERRQSSRTVATLALVLREQHSHWAVRAVLYRTEAVSTGEADSSPVNSTTIRTGVRTGNAFSSSIMAGSPHPETAHPDDAVPSGINALPRAGVLATGPATKPAACATRPRYHSRRIASGVALHQYSRVRHRVKPEPGGHRRRAERHGWRRLGGSGLGATHTAGALYIEDPGRHLVGRPDRGPVTTPSSCGAPSLAAGVSPNTVEFPSSLSRGVPCSLRRVYSHGIWVS